MANQTLTGLAYQAIAWDIPASGAKSVNTGTLNWTAFSQYTLDPTSSNQLLEMQNIQSIFCDNYNTGTLIVTVASTGHLIRVPPKSQCFMPLICGDRPVITFTNVGGNGNSQCWLMNVPALGIVWNLP